jgi:hypothetical protein
VSTKFFCQPPKVAAKLKEIMSNLDNSASTLGKTTAAITQSSSIGLLWASARLTSEIYASLLARGATRLILLHLVELATGQFFQFATEYIQMSGRESIVMIASVAMLELTISMLWSAAWILAIADIADSIWRGRLGPVSFRTSFTQHFNQLLIEQVRALAAVLWRIPLVVLPAFAEYIRLVFVPLVVILNGSYEHGETDALKESRALCRGRFWMLTLVICTSLFIPWYLQSLIHGDSGELIWENPIGVSFASLVTLFINVFTSAYLWAIFRNLYPILKPVPRMDQGPNHDQTSTIVLS